MADIHFQSGNFVFDVRAAGVLVKNGKILVQREKNGSEYALSSGHVQLGETTSGALMLEYREETGAYIRCDLLLWTEECFWEWNSRKHHSFTFYYLISLCDGSAIPDAGEFVPHKDNSSIVIGWMPISELKNTIIYPEFLKQKIHDLDSPLEHFITR